MFIHQRKMEMPDKAKGHDNRSKESFSGRSVRESRQVGLHRPLPRSVDLLAVIQRTEFGDRGKVVLDRKSRTDKRSVRELREGTAYRMRSTLVEAPGVFKLENVYVTHHHIISAKRLNEFWGALHKLDAGVTDGGDTLIENLMYKIADQYVHDSYTVRIGENQIKEHKLNKDIASKFSFELTSETMKNVIGHMRDGFEESFVKPDGYDESIHKIYVDVLYERVLDAVYARYQWMPGNLVAGPQPSLPRKEYLTRIGAKKIPSKFLLHPYEWIRLDDPKEGFDEMASTLKVDPKEYKELDEILERFIDDVAKNNGTRESLVERANGLIDRLAALRDLSAVGNQTMGDDVMETDARWLDSYEGPFVDTPQGRMNYEQRKDDEMSFVKKVNKCVNVFMTSYGEQFNNMIAEINSCIISLSQRNQTPDERAQALKRKKEIDGEMENLIDTFLGAVTSSSGRLGAAVKKELFELKSIKLSLLRN